MDEPKKKIKLTPQNARLKMESWCAYQERSHYEVREKLYSYGLYSDDVNNIISHLIQENFLNEERFAEAYVSGKFKIKGWGKIKIKQALKLKRVSEANIKLALRQLDTDDYFEKLLALARKKNRMIAEKHPLKRRQKLTAYLAAKGYESDLVFEAVKTTLAGDQHE